MSIGLHKESLKIHTFSPLVTIPEKEELPG